MYHVVTFYKFTPLADLPAHQADIQARAEKIAACGTLLIAPEGVNATLAAPNLVDLQNLTAYLKDTYQIAPSVFKWSTSAAKLFQRLKIRLKKEIITMNRPGVDAATLTGTQVPAADWNAVIARDDVMLLDTRNTYEVKCGTFTGAVTPPLHTFTDFADYVDRELDPVKTPHIAMFCTGGIRCEKASSYMLQKGFQTVYQLEGGILKYLETVPEGESTWQGGCFVFDERVALGHGLVTTPIDRKSLD